MTLWYQAGSFGRPKLDAIRITSSPPRSRRAARSARRRSCARAWSAGAWAARCRRRFTRPCVNFINFGSIRLAMLIPYQVPGFESANGIRRRLTRVGGRSGSTLGIGTRLAYAHSGAGIAAGDDPVAAGALDGDPVPPGAAEPALGDPLPAAAGAALDDDRARPCGRARPTEDVAREHARAEAGDRGPRRRAVGGDPLERARDVAQPQPCPGCRPSRRRGCGRGCRGTWRGRSGPTRRACGRSPSAGGRRPSRGRGCGRCSAASSGGRASSGPTGRARRGCTASGVPPQTFSLFSV